MANDRKKYFPLPYPIGFYSGDKDTVRHIRYLKHYYSFEWENALFVTIDPYWQFDQFRPDWPLQILQFMVRNKATIFFQWHDHLFARQELDGVVYQSVPNPANDTYTAFNRDAYTSEVVLPNSGILNVTVSKHAVKVEYIRSFPLYHRQQ